MKIFCFVFQCCYLKVHEGKDFVFELPLFTIIRISFESRALSPSKRRGPLNRLTVTEGLKFPAVRMMLAWRAGSGTSNALRNEVLSDKCQRDYAIITSPIGNMGNSEL